MSKAKKLNYDLITLIVPLVPTINASQGYLTLAFVSIEAVLSEKDMLSY